MINKLKVEINQGNWKKTLIIRVSKPFKQIYNIIEQKPKYLLILFIYYYSILFFIFGFTFTHTFIKRH